MAERTAISMASKSRRPVRRRPWKMTRNSWPTSRAISCWIASAVFFLWRERVRNRAGPTDLGVDLYQFPMQALQFAELRDFPFGLPLRGLARKSFGSGLAFDLVSQPEIGAMARILGTMAMAVGFATPA